MKTLIYHDGDVGDTDWLIDQPFELVIDEGAAVQAGDLLDDLIAFPIEKLGDGTLTLTGDNTYAGPTLVSEGTLVLAPDPGTVNSASDFTIAAGATLAFGKHVGGAFLASISGAGDIDLGDIDYLELDALVADHVFSGRIFDDADGLADFSLCGCGGGSLTLTGNSNIGGALDIGFDATLVLDGGRFTAGGGLFLDGTFSIVNGATFSTTMITGASLVVDGWDSSATAFDHTLITGPLTVSGGALLTSLDGADIITCGCDEGLATALVTGHASLWDITGSLLMDVPVDGGILTVADGGTVRASVSIVIGPDSVLNIGEGAAAGGVDTPTIVNDGKIVADFTGGSTLDADIEGSGTLEKHGTGILTLTGEAAHSGGTTVDEGRLNVNGTAAAGIVVGDGGTLGGTGSLGTVFVLAGGTFAPGVGIGEISTEEFVLSEDARFAADIAGNRPGTGYDRVSVTGGVDIAGAVLDLALPGGFEPRPGQRFRVIDNDGDDAIVGTFAGLAEGATFLVDGRLMTITYTGGDGNDVVLRKAPAPTVITGTSRDDVIDRAHTVSDQPLPTREADHVFGRAGDDRIAALGGDDRVEAGSGRDAVRGGGGDDVLFGGKHRDDLRGQAGDDALKGGNGSDVLRGGAGDDRLTGGGGDNKLAGGGGNDVFVFRQAEARDVITDYASGDRIALLKAAFPGIGPLGILKAKYFHVGSEAQTPLQHVLYDKTSGWLLYAEKGSATDDPHQLVKVGKNLGHFDHTDILVL